MAVLLLSLVLMYLIYFIQCTIVHMSIGIQFLRDEITDFLKLYINFYMKTLTNVGQWVFLQLEWYIK